MIKNIYYKQEKFLLDIPEFHLKENEITGLFGRSGSGKTTLIYILTGLLQSQKNFSWIFNGENLALLPVEKKQLGILFQDLRLFPHLTVRDQIWFPVKAQGLEKDNSIHKRFETLLTDLDLKNKLDQDSISLSGGEKQKVALARALITKPRFLFLDEPFSHLDIRSQESAKKLIQEVLSSYKLGALLISHNSTAENIVQNVLKLENGKLTS